MVFVPSLVQLYCSSRKPVMQIIDNLYDFLFTRTPRQLFKLISTAPRPLLLSGARSLRNTPRVTFAHCSLKGREI